MRDARIIQHYVSSSKQAKGEKKQNLEEAQKALERKLQYPFPIETFS